MIELFNCKTCDFVKEYPNEDSPTQCPECGSKWYLIKFITKPRIKAKFVSIGYKDTPRYSITLGVSEIQIEEAKRLHPWVDWKKFGHSYRPLIKNRTDKKRLMREANYEEFSPKDFKGRGR